MPGAGEEIIRRVACPAILVNPDREILRPIMTLIDPDNFRSMRRFLAWLRQKSQSPAKMFRIAQFFHLPAFERLREPASVLEQVGQYYPAAAAKMPKLRLRRAASSKVAIKDRAAVTTAGAKKPNPPAVAAPKKPGREDLKRQRQLSAPGQATDLIANETAKLPPSLWFEPKDPHKGNVA